MNPDPKQDQTVTPEQVEQTPEQTEQQARQTAEAAEAEQAKRAAEQAERNAAKQARREEMARARRVKQNEKLPADATADSAVEQYEQRYGQGVTTQDTAGLRGVVSLETDPVAHTPKRIVVSQGTYDDLVRFRKVTDPGTGFELRVEEGGKVVAYDRRTDKPADIEVICPEIKSGSGR